MMEETPQVVEIKKEAPPLEVPRPVRAVIRALDTFTDWIGKSFAWITVPMVLALSYEVFARKFFNRPTVWAFDISYMLYGSLFMLGAGFALLRKAHIRTDLFYNNWSPRVQGLVDGLLYLLIFFPGIIFFLLAGLDAAQHAWSISEKSDASPWRPPLYPYRTVVPVAAGLILIQGISEFIKCVYAVVKGKWL